MKSRRQFLKTLGGGLAASFVSPHVFQLLSQSLMTSAIQQAAAQSLPSACRKMVSLSIYGAPLRLTFDHFLQTRADEIMVPNPMVATRFSRGQSEAGIPVYEVENFVRADSTSILVPPLWKTAIKTTSGTEKMESLLNNMIVFRGYGTDVDGHPSNFAKQLWPLSSVASIGGLISDQSTNMFPAIQFPNNNGAGFKSSGKVSILSPNHYTGNVLRGLYLPFEQYGEAINGTRISSTYANRLQDIQSRLRTIFDTLPETKKFAKDHTLNAMVSIKKGVSGFDDVWNSYFQRYQEAIQLAARDLTVPGFTDQPIVKRVEDDLRFRFMFPDLKDPQTAVGYNLQTDATTWKFDEMAQGFALSEYLIGEGVSDYVDVLTHTAPRMDSTLLGQRATRTHIYDEHAAGASISTFLNALLFRGLSGGLIEIKKRFQQKTLGGQNLYDQTIFRVTSEFGRAPRHDASGSDHGFNAMITSVFSGAVKKGPFVLGNIAREHAPGTAYSGTWGQRAPTTIAGQSHLLTPIHVNSSLAVLAKAPTNPWINLAPAMLKEQNNEILLADGVTEGRII